MKMLKGAWRFAAMAWFVVLCLCYVIPFRLRGKSHVDKGRTVKAWAARFLDWMGVRVVYEGPTLDPEVAATGVTVSLGHQLATSPADIAPCMAAGAKAFTHLGNGIPNEVNRHDNIVYTALVEDRAHVMFIPDGHHLPDTMLKLYVRAVPLERLVAVSDAQYPAGMPPGEYTVCGARARLEPNGLLWNPSRNCLVGATTPIAKCMEILRERIGLTPDECRAIGHDNALALIGAD